MGWTSLVRLMIHAFVDARDMNTPVIWFRVGVVCWLYSSAATFTFCAAFVCFGRPDIFSYSVLGCLQLQMFFLSHDGFHLGMRDSCSEAESWTP
jgi:hypothetical protein